MKQLLFFITLVSVNTVFSQLAPNKYLIEFKDKENSPFSVENPYEFLGERAIARRLKQQILIQESDIPVNQSYIDMVLQFGEFELVSQSKWMNAIVVYTTDTLALDSLSQLNFVKNASRKYNNRLAQRLEYFSKLETINSTIDYGDATRQTEMLNLQLLHDLGWEGNEVAIAVFDAGFNKIDELDAFTKVRNENRILGRKDFASADELTNFYKATHGRSVFSIMAAQLENEYVGAAPQANYWLFRTEDGDSEYLIEEFNWLVAAEYADSIGVDVINSSLGYTVFSDSTQNHTYADMNGNSTIVTKAADWAASKGMIVVNSAGNSGNSSWYYVGAPADADSILTVGAVKSDETKASFSSFGPTSDGRIKPTVVAQGQSTYVIGSSGKPNPGSGTSFSAPIIAGAVACLWQAFPFKTNMEIIEAVKKSANQYQNPDNNLGYGIPDFYNAYQDLLAQETLVGKSYFTLFPNPITAYLYVNYYAKSEEKITVSIFSIAGKQISNKQFNVNKFRNLLTFKDEFNGLSAGVYLIQIKNEEEVLTQRFVKTLKN